MAAASITSSTMPPYSRSDDRTTPFLYRAISFADFQDQRSSDWVRSSTPTSPSSSTSTLTAGIDTPQTDTEPYGSRTPTPTPTPTPIATSDGPRVTTQRRSQFSTNPFLSQSRPASPTARSVPTSPRSLSRASTPLGTGFERPPLHSPSKFPRRTFPPPSLSRDSHFHQPAARPSNLNEMPYHGPPLSILARPNMMPMEPIPPQFITLHLLDQYSRTFPKVCRRQGWIDGSDALLIRDWSIRQRKTALLLWMCNELPAWGHAAFYGLGDAKLPFKEEDLNNIVADPAKVLEMQWKVAMKQLPRKGQHVEFLPDEAIPLEDLGQIGEPRIRGKTLAKVRYLGTGDDTEFVRKRFEFPDGSRARIAACREQIDAYKALDHDNLTKITSSYQQGQVIAFTYPYAQYSLAEYLSTPPNIDGRTFLNWILHLSDALAYIHSNQRLHKSIRPQKILIDTALNKILFSPFGICRTGRSPHSRLSEEPSYIYAAPEVIREHPVGTPAEVYSLGACFLDILTVARGHNLQTFTDYRSKLSHDLSFQANPDTVAAWIDHLRTTSTGYPLSPRMERTLVVVKAMLNPDPLLRPDMRRVVSVLKGKKERAWSAAGRFDFGYGELLPRGSAIYNDLSPLDEYFRAPSVYDDE